MIQNDNQSLEDKVFKIWFPLSPPSCPFDNFMALLHIEIYTNGISYPPAYPYVVKAFRMIEEDLPLGLTSPSSYIRAVAKFIANKKEE